MACALVLSGLPSGTSPAIATELARALTGDPAAVVTTATADTPAIRAAAAAADVVLVVATAERPGPLLPRALVERCARERLLDDAATVAVVLGGWPARANEAHAVTATLSRLGAACLSPTLQIDLLADPRVQVAAFARRWAPLLTARRQLAARAVPELAAG